MIKVALKGLAGRKVRALLTALAVVIGVSMVSGTFVLTDTIKQAFDGIFAESYADTDAVVTGQVPASVLKDVQALPGVETAAASLQDFADNSNPTRLYDQQGQPIGTSEDTYGVAFDNPAFTPLELKSGKWPHG